MPDDIKSPQSSDSAGKQSVGSDPVKTPDSEARLKELAFRIAKVKEKQSVTPTPNSSVKEERTLEAGSSGKGAEETPTSSSTAKIDKQDSELSKGKTEEESDSQKKVKKPEDKINWVEESKKHQSRADKLQKQIDEEYLPLKSEYEKLKQSFEEQKAKVDSFVKDPVKFINDYLPDLGEKLSRYQDPVAFIEGEISEFKQQLDEQFKKQYGEDWIFSEVESLRPGTPSFRYKLAIDDRIADVRSRQREYVESRKRQLEESKRQIELDKKKLSDEFGFTEADFKIVDDYLSKNPVSYYGLAQMVLLSQIIEKKLAGLSLSTSPPPDITSAGGGGAGDIDKGKDKVKFSPKAREILSRVGIAPFQQF